MPDPDDSPTDAAPARSGDAPRALSAAAHRALAEAEARRAAREHAEASRPVELGGRDGPDPARYGDWEKKGLAIDF